MKARLQGDYPRSCDAGRCRACCLPLWEPSNILRGLCASCWEASMLLRLAWLASGVALGCAASALAWWAL